MPICMLCEFSLSSYEHCSQWRESLPSVCACEIMLSMVSYPSTYLRSTRWSTFEMMASNMMTKPRAFRCTSRLKKQRSQDQLRSVFISTQLVSHTARLSRAQQFRVGSATSSYHDRRKDISSTDLHTHHILTSYPYFAI